MARPPRPNFRTDGAGASRRTSLLRFVVASMVGLLAGFTLFVFFSGDDDPNSDGGQSPTRADDAVVETAADGGPSTTTLELGDDSTMKCMVPTARLLKQQELAFEGTVNTIEANAVSLDVKTWFKGDPTDQVVVRNADPQLRLALSGVDFEVGPTYLVSASEGQVTMCGLSGEATPDLSRLFARAFPA